ncbi:hypothetical protein AC249_AIPGENE21891 [Exaiptasia diaphana]|nr:hypothetical protein AC249_AIPGENE21891 [Exaiptasia diaphana]
MLNELGCDMLIPVPYTATRASGHSFLLPKIIRDYYKYSFFPRTLKDWNNLPPKIALSPTLALFKASVADLIRV